MREELDKQLCKDFPLLYKDRFASMRSTCMCWGFPGDGWEPIIRELSSKLEPLIRKYIDDNYPLRCDCGCLLANHGNLKKCETVYRIPYSVKYYWKPVFWMAFPKTLKEKFGVLKVKMKYSLMVKSVQKIQRIINKFLNFLHEKFNITKMLPCSCKRYSPSYPSASQVKEKFGTLRFYMTSETDEMYDLIREAEEKSETTCEDCGSPGVLRDSGWILTLCDNCATKDGIMYPPYSSRE